MADRPRPGHGAPTHGRARLPAHARHAPSAEGDSHRAGRSPDRVVVDPNLDGRTVQVEYDQHPGTGEITDVRIVSSEHATAADVHLHVATARAMLRYSGLSGRSGRSVSELARALGSRRRRSVRARGRLG